MTKTMTDTSTYLKWVTFCNAFSKRNIFITSKTKTRIYRSIEVGVFSCRNKMSMSSVCMLLNTQQQQSGNVQSICRYYYEKQREYCCSQLTSEEEIYKNEPLT